MLRSSLLCLTCCVAFLVGVQTSSAPQHPLVGLIPRATNPNKMKGTLADWQGAFVTPVHVGNPNFADRGGQFLYLWDDQNLYIGLRCLDRKPWHSGAANQIWNGDAVEFYLDTRRGAQFGAKEFGPGTLHMFWTPFTRDELAARMGIRDLPAFKNLVLTGAEVRGDKTPWGYTAEFKLPWSNFPNFKAAAGEIIGIECELCSSDGGPRVDRTFVYSSPAAVGSPSAFGRVQLVDKLDPEVLQPFSRALMPVSITQSLNYAWLYATVCVSPTLEARVAKVQATVCDAGGKVWKRPVEIKKGKQEGISLWEGSLEVFDLPPGMYKLQISALDRHDKVLASRELAFSHDQEARK
jgi:hypothetical protein